MVVVKLLDKVVLEELEKVPTIEKENGFLPEAPVSCHLLGLMNRLISALLSLVVSYHDPLLSE